MTNYRKRGDVRTVTVDFGVGDADQLLELELEEEKYISANDVLSLSSEEIASGEHQDELEDMKVGRDVCSWVVLGVNAPEPAPEGSESEG